MLMCVGVELPDHLLLLLQILVELAIERQQELPALIYESRPTNRPYQRGMWRRQQAGQDSGNNANNSSSSDGGGLGGNGAGLAPVVAAVAGGAGVQVISGDVLGSPSVSARVALLGEQQRSWDDDSPQVSQEMALGGGSSSGVGSGSGGSGRFGSARRRGSGTGDRAGNGAVPLAEGKEEDSGEECRTLQQLRLQQQQQQQHGQEAEAAWLLGSAAAAAAAAAAKMSGGRGAGPLGEGVEDDAGAGAGSSSSRGGLLQASAGSASDGR
jgi:presenilin 1